MAGSMFAALSARRTIPMANPLAESNSLISFDFLSCGFYHDRTLR
jgi:hypothetical protein